MQMVSVWGCVVLAALAVLQLTTAQSPPTKPTKPPPSVEEATGPRQIGALLLQLQSYISDSQALHCFKTMASRNTSSGEVLANPTLCRESSNSSLNNDSRAQATLLLRFSLDI